MSARSNTIPWSTVVLLALSLPAYGPAHTPPSQVRVVSLAQAMSFVPPVDGPIGSSFGLRKMADRNERHQGLDIRSAMGTPVHVTAAGRVVSTGFNSGYGKNVLVAHASGLTTLYAHLSSITVKEGQPLRAGQTIGRVGNTGFTTGPHLHFEVRWNGHSVDPQRFLASQSVRSLSLRD